MFARHRKEAAAPRVRQANLNRPPIGRMRLARHETFLRQTVDQPGDRAIGHHHAPRRVAHGEHAACALQLREEIETGERNAKFGDDPALQARIRCGWRSRAAAARCGFRDARAQPRPRRRGRLGGASALAALA